MMESSGTYLAVIKVVRVGGGGTNAVNRMVDACLRGVGFIAANTSAQALQMCDADIKLNIDRYLQLYGRERISGFFLDEMASETQRRDFYRDIYIYIKSIDPGLRVVGNPGMVPAAQYASVEDTIVVFESTASDYQKFDPRPQNARLYSYANQTQAMLAHNTASCAAMQTAMQAAATARNNAGLVYATDREYNFATDVGNPWSGLPAYWETLVRTVDAINRGATLPRC